MKMPWLLIALLAPASGLLADEAHADELRVDGRSAQSTRASLSLMHHQLDQPEQIALATALLRIQLAEADRRPTAATTDAMEVLRTRINGLSYRQILQLGERSPARIEIITRPAADARP